ncbi:hypothetical protein ACFXAF_28400 [Kitasatospora sp. NPDC059463]|uniref:hypothetical protein n=1 Tax=unclassified Kitasatospora TaxID=2633591 RepID=UPI0036948948
MDPETLDLHGTRVGIARAFGTAYGPASGAGERTRYHVLAYLAPSDLYLVAVGAIDSGSRSTRPHPREGRSGWTSPEQLTELVVAHPVRDRRAGRTFCHHHIVPAAPELPCRICLIRLPRTDCSFFDRSRYAPLPPEAL